MRPTQVVYLKMFRRKYLGFISLVLRFPRSGLRCLWAIPGQGPRQSSSCASSCWRTLSPQRGSLASHEDQVAEVRQVAIAKVAPSHLTRGQVAGDTYPGEEALLEGFWKTTAWVLTDGVEARWGLPGGAAALRGAS